MVFIKKEYRIKKSTEIDKIIKAKNSVGNKYFVIYQLQNDETEHFRFALSIGKKYGNAVSRNKMKRRLRDIIRQNIHLLKERDYLFVIKPSANTLSFDEIKGMLVSLFTKRG